MVLNYKNVWFSNYGLKAFDVMLCIIKAGMMLICSVILFGLVRYSLSQRVLCHLSLLCTNVANRVWILSSLYRFLSNVCIFRKQLWFSAWIKLSMSGFQLINTFFPNISAVLCVYQNVHSSSLAIPQKIYITWGGGTNKAIWTINVCGFILLCYNLQNGHWV